ncbi:MAG: hypothetical protein JNG84_14835 [Archangium sp.]|nr:hypothetical protein [Archangium sp.]
MADGDDGFDGDADRTMDPELHRIIENWRATPSGFDACAQCVQERSEAVLASGPMGMNAQLAALRHELSALDAVLRRHLREGRAIQDELLVRRVSVGFVLDAFEPLVDESHLARAA